MQPSSCSSPDEPVLSPRLEKLKFTVQSSQPSVCIERAILVTQYHRKRHNRKKNSHIRQAEALRYVLQRKKVSIYPGELIVGNYSSKRVGGSIYPELHGIPVLEDLWTFTSRKTNPLDITFSEQLALCTIVPFWLTRFLAFRAYFSPIKKAKLIINQLRNLTSLINETGGIAHLAPDYRKLIALGTDGIRQEAEEYQQKQARDSDEWFFYEGVKIIADSLAEFGARYAIQARKELTRESDPVRRQELTEIIRTCEQVPRKPARSFREALQSILFAQIAINLESLDNAICPGRMDDYLFPFYETDRRNGFLTGKETRELLGCFFIKMAEIIPVFSRRITRFHGGMFNGQVVTVGGTDTSGTDMTNDLSMIILELMDALRMRQPNFHARLHRNSTREYRQKIASILSKGGNSPALYNDDVIVPMMAKIGYSIDDARNYTAVGCVEPVSQGKSFSSTDAALFNVPLMLELSLNEGKRFGSPVRLGPKTTHPSKMVSMDDILAAFQTQLQAGLHRLIDDLQAIERANARYHPTPLTSMLLDGCLEKGKCSTAGGARYNFSGIQAVGPVDTGDALFAIEQVVFVRREKTLSDFVSELKKDFENKHFLQECLSLPKFGNDIAVVDRWTDVVITAFEQVLSSRSNTRGGRYVAGLYSVTAHEWFGRVTGASANGRRQGQPFASGIAPMNGMDREGPTALINSVNRLKLESVANGVNFNLKFDSFCLRGDKGPVVLDSLLKTYFRRGGMQVQVNVIAADVLKKAKEQPGLFPNLLVRVSGYSAYFHDLTPEMQDEIIERTQIHT